MVQSGALRLAPDGPQNLAVVRKIALNIIKADKTSKASLKAKSKMPGWNHKFLLSLFAKANS
jgi:hypothetical protein